MPRPIPGRRLYPGLSQTLALVHISHYLLIPGRSLVTPVASWWGALLGPIDPSGAIPASLAGRARAWSAWLRGSGLGFSFCLAVVRDIQHREWARSPVQSGCFRKGGVYLQPRVRASGAGQQRVQQAWPLLSSLPCLSIETSQLLPRRQSREGFGRGLLESR